MRIAALVVAALDSAIWAVLALVTFFSGSDPASKGLDVLAGTVITLLFLLTAGVSLLLIWRRKASGIALLLALAFPLLMVAFAAAVIATLD